MATIARQYTEHCKCQHGCRTWAKITEWTCGCVDVDLRRDQQPGSDCTDFSGMRRRCGKPGRPSDQ